MNERKTDAILVGHQTQPAENFMAVIVNNQCIYQATLDGAPTTDAEVIAMLREAADTIEHQIIEADEENYCLREGDVEEAYELEKTIALENCREYKTRLE